MFDDKDVPSNLPTGALQLNQASSPAGGEVSQGDGGVGANPSPTLAMPDKPKPAVAPKPLAAGNSPLAPVEDMFDAVDAPVPPAGELPTAMCQSPSARKGSALKIILFIAAADWMLLALIAWGAFALLGATEDELTPASSPAGGVVPQRGGVVGVNETPTPEPDPTPASVPQEPVQEPDGDGDGLTDAEEARYGTAIHKPDTDNDGLFDREEVMVYRTNPLSADTDGDGFLDGSEVSNGYNPNGPGRLTELPTSKD